MASVRTVRTSIKDRTPSTRGNSMAVPEGGNVRFNVGGPVHVFHLGQTFVASKRPPHAETRAAVAAIRHSMKTTADPGRPDRRRPGQIIPRQV
jgi:hypothetical protein